jgi:hypothetical protein
VAELTTHLNNWISKTRGVGISDITLLLYPARRGATPLVRMAQVRMGTDGEIRRMVCFNGFTCFDRAITTIVIRCSTTGAVHLEMIDCMDTSSFLLAVKRLLALRPPPSVFIADNETNFKEGDSALQGITEKGQIDLAKAQSHFNIKFQFAPPRAPHFQGLVEGFVGATKAAIHSAVHAHTLTDEELWTVFGRAMVHLNNVPVACTVGSEADFHYLPLTPGHLLMGSAYAEQQPIDTENTKLTNATRYDRVCSVLELFWKSKQRYYTLGTDSTGTDGNGWRNLTDSVFRRVHVLRPSNNKHSRAVGSGRPIM